MSQSKHIETLFPRRLVAIAVAAIIASPLAAQTVENWSQSVWNSAIQGDRSALMQHFEAAPIDAVPEEHAEVFRQSFEQRLKNQEASEHDRQAALEKVLGEIREYTEADNLSRALRSAVEAQMLCVNLEDAFAIPEVAQVIEWAQREIPDVKRSEDWILAYELLYRLRALYEDTGRHQEYERFDQQLEMVNQRLALLQRYAPRQMHELRSRTVIRLGEEPLGEFNPAFAADWGERLDGVTLPMLRDALSNAARKHIENEGWRPMLLGGLESLRLMATTTLLEETFATLADESNVKQWVVFLDDERAKINNADDRALERGWITGLLDRIAKTNRQTVNLPDRVLYREFGDGAMQRLDQFSEIIWPDKVRRFRQATEGNFVGVGIMIRYNEKREIVVSNPLEGTPAYFAGIKPDDIIMTVDGESTAGWSLNDAVDRITGPKGVMVKLGIRREDSEELLQFPIVRDTIKMRTVAGWWKSGISDDGDPKWDWYIDPASRIAYVWITGFNEETFADLRKAWRELAADGRPNGLILDLRYNPGGLLTSAVDIANLFINAGVIVSGEDKNGAQAWRRRAAPSRAELFGVPTVVLINKGSASGSEIVAGALQAHGAAVIIGDRSYGKGSVQTVDTLAIAQGQPVAALKLTTQYYRLPPANANERGRLVHRRPGADVWGVDPDIDVRMSITQLEASRELRQAADIIPEGEDGKLDPHSPDRPNINDLLTKGHDPQLEAALLILQARALGPLSADRRRAAR